MTYENFVKGQLVAFAHREGARHGAKSNMLAVAQVIANRVRAGWNGGDWLATISTASEFVGTVYEEGPKLNPRDPSFRSVLQMVDDIYHGNSPDDLTDGSLFYAELHNLNRDWFTTTILRQPEQHPRKAQVGQVSFFG